jgi:hypothetical protein
VLALDAFNKHVHDHHIHQEKNKHRISLKNKHRSRVIIHNMDPHLNCLEK